MSSLAQEKCRPCHQACVAATASEKKQWLKQLPGWSVTKEAGVPTLKKSFEFADFKKALKFTDRVGTEADRQDHHPSILLEYGQVTVSWNTHAIKNLHRNDFVMAAKTNALFRPRK